MRNNRDFDWNSDADANGHLTGKTITAAEWLPDGDLLALDLNDGTQVLVYGWAVEVYTPKAAHNHA